jgi:hypothetical protein
MFHGQATGLVGSSFEMISKVTRRQERFVAIRAGPHASGHCQFRIPPRPVLVNILMFVTAAAWKPDLSIVTAHTCATTGKEASSATRGGMDLSVV